MKKLKQFPDTLTIILCIMLIFWGLTWIIPAGSFERTTFGSKEIVVPNSYTPLSTSHEQGLLEFLMAPIKGFQQAAGIIGFVLIIGGAFGIINRTGAINAGLQRIVRFSNEQPQYKKGILPLLIILFSLAGATFGMSEEVLVFIMITIPMAQALGYDSIVGVAVPFVGAGAGFAGAFLNPFTVGIAQGIAELPPASGMGYRLICWSVFTLIAIGFIMKYALSIQKNPEKSTVRAIDNQRKFDPNAILDSSINLSQKFVLFLFLIAIILLVYGVNAWGWYINEISGLFFGLGLLAAIVCKLTMKETSTAFLEGTKDVLTAALIIAFSRGLLVLAEDGKIIDTLLNSVASGASGLPNAISIQIMFLFQSFLNFFIPSGSGQAALTMPIMAPLSDLLNISRQTAVLAYQFGDGISNLIIPTSGITMGILEIAKIPYDKWFKWVLPLILILSFTAMLLLLPPTLWFNWP